jgi:hypothetical protein
VLLIIEDDPHYARILLGIARAQGFQGHRREPWATGALARARISADGDQLSTYFLPDMLGWTVLNNLKLDPRRGTSLCRCCRSKKQRQHGLAHGAFTYSRQTSDDRRARERIRQAQVVRRAAHEAAAGHRRQRPRARRVSSSFSATTTSRSWRSEPGARRFRHCGSGATTAASSIYGCRT